MKTRADVVIIGAGPAGLSAAISSACDGFHTVVVDGNKVAGGQAVEATRIENLLGFPDGIDGLSLISASMAQAKRFGVDFMLSFHAIDLERDNDVWRVTCADGDCVEALTVVIATGVKYNKLEAKNCESFINRGVSYGSPRLDGIYDGQSIAVVGAGNSSGQAALFLAAFPGTKVTMVARGDKLPMSWYLRDRLRSTDNITILYNTEVTEVFGESWISHIHLQCENNIARLDVSRLYNLIGSTPKTWWLRNKLSLNEKGFIKTGYENYDCNKWASYSPNRLPMPLESLPGVFAIGDVRSGIAKRVSSAVGDGAEVVSEIGRYINSLPHA